MSYEWNITAEIVHREYRSFGSSKTHARNSGSFIKSCLGSCYLVQQMGATRTVKETQVCSANFNSKGDFISIGCRDKQIAIYDWAHNNLIDVFDSEHTEGVCGVRFMDTNDNTLNITSNSYDGQIRHGRILPTGELITGFMYKHPRRVPNLTSVPRSPYEFIVVDTQGNIFQVDLRCRKVAISPDACVQNAEGSYLPLYDVSHHPYSNEISIGGFDPFLRIFDKRNLKECVRKMCPEILENLTKISKCSYNYNGSEILATYGARVCHYLFDNRYFAPTNYSISEKAGFEGTGDACFFGPKSEFVVCVEQDCISFFHKKIGRIVNSFLPPGLQGDPSVTLTGLQPHPSLPLIACTSYNKGVFILAPTKKSINHENFFVDF